MGRCRIDCETVLHKICPACGSCTDDRNKYGQGETLVPLADGSQLILHYNQRNGLEVSLGMVTADHPFLDPRQLEAEATGLLDRMLGVLQDNSRYG